MRKLATIRKIDAIRPIEGADAIECAVVGGWTVVVKKGEYQPGDLAVFCEIDSFVPHELAPFLSKGQQPREYNGVRGERLRTVKLRGQLSQGLLLPLNVLAVKTDSGNYLGDWDQFEGHDVTGRLNIQKWEAPIPAQLAGEVRGPFPSFIPKTDQERVQNLTVEFNRWFEAGLRFEVTEKLDGSSMTVYDFHGDQGVCSRNLNLKETGSNSLWKTCRRDYLLDKIAGRNLALQGELIGEGIQGNPYKIKGQRFFVFDIYDIRAGRYLTPAERRDFCRQRDIDHVPVLAADADLYDTLGIRTVEDLLKFAEGKSVFADVDAEGAVLKCTTDPNIHFKAISNKFLLKGGN